ncbi:GPO family capsid scaffolding protein [Xenorhabdus nematophila]|uniref:Presumed capsid scaffolding protein (GpO) n=1 Tax=Xenorhabdus nematophila (strain ATCC 19061 / DSM 3370 / CCUG 14189 / LMG 1036 / NCIMB 9965 / AN6) TaxID=406817 RepID=D3VKM7_XENNA|nr:GPO family capsid scaffolding protein [Xenorhabdus nematophila]CBJ91135.1 Presumed capsid scaffolding protein (GpO) [Xenorhabdus nematophila ATCC 19061]CEK23956.1 Presumed capsid scaffolding protein (GpO) [Xenorhabdus nematophila AN6/1]
MATKSKPFRICVEGATTDGRKIQRAWLNQIADNYDPSTYGARINQEHYNYSWSPRFGDVESVYTEEIKDGKLAGKLGLYGVLSPTDELVAMNRKRQKVYTSAEINLDFADSGGAYLVGLAVTDSPASLGTEMLQFSAGAAINPLTARKQHPDNIFTAAEETVLEFVELPADNDKPSLFSRVQAFFQKKQQSDDARFADIHQAVELCAQEQQTTAETVTTLVQQLGEFSALKQKQATLEIQLNDLTTRLSRQDNNPTHRPFSQGSQHADAPTAEHLTNC